jgi:hypothetical protein
VLDVMSPDGPSRHFAALRKFGRYRGNIGLSPPNALKIYGFTA